MEYIHIFYNGILVENIKMMVLRRGGYELLNDIKKGSLIKYTNKVEEPSVIEELLVEFLFTDKYKNYKEIQDRNNIVGIAGKFEKYLYNLRRKNDYDYKRRPDLFTDVEKMLLDYLLSHKKWNWKYSPIYTLRKYYKRLNYDRDREIYRLYKIEGKSYKDISLRYHISVSTVRSAVWKAEIDINESGEKL